MTQKSKLAIVFAVSFIIICAALLFYGLGYRITDTFHIGRLGKISVTTPLAGTSVFLDTTEKKTSSADGEVIYLSVTPENHTIIVSRDGYFPWTKTVTVPSGGAVQLFPIIVPQNPSGVIITSRDSAYRDIIAKIAGNILPTTEAPLRSADKSVSVWVEHNALVTQIGNTLHTVIQPDTLVRNVGFYKDRSDALIFSNHDGVYMIEIDQTNTPNFMPIYRGADPVFVPASQNTLYVKDGTTVMEVNI